MTTSTPEGHADRARELEAAGMFHAAAVEWRNAKAASIGHKRRDRYEAAAEACDRRTGATPAPEPAAVRTINATPTWREAAAIIAAVLEDGTAEGRAAARAELFRMAAMLDELRAAQQEPDR